LGFVFYTSIKTWKCKKPKEMFCNVFLRYSNIRRQSSFLKLCSYRLFILWKLVLKKVYSLMQIEQPSVFENIFTHFV